MARILFAFLLISIALNYASGACFHVDTQDLLEYSCTGGHIAELNGVPEGVERLKISRMRIPIITPHTFSRFSESLLVLKCSECEISDIEQNAFSGLQYLQQLSLDNNRLTSVKASWLEGLRDLNYLDLTYNQIENIEDDAFQYLGEVTDLRLSGNRLKCLNLDSMSQMANLKRIFLNDNPEFQCPNAITKFLKDRNVIFQEDQSWEDITEDLVPASRNEHQDWRTTTSRTYPTNSRNPTNSENSRYSVTSSYSETSRDSQPSRESATSRYSEASRDSATSRYSEASRESATPRYSEASRDSSSARDSTTSRYSESSRDSATSGDYPITTRPYPIPTSAYTYPTTVVYRERMTDTRRPSVTETAWTNYPESRPWSTMTPWSQRPVPTESDIAREDMFRSRSGGDSQEDYNPHRDRVLVTVPPRASWPRTRVEETTYPMENDPMVPPTEAVHSKDVYQPKDVQLAKEVYRRPDYVPRVTQEVENYRQPDETSTVLNLERVETEKPLPDCTNSSSGISVFRGFFLFSVLLFVSKIVLVDSL